MGRRIKCSRNRWRLIRQNCSRASVGLLLSLSLNRANREIKTHLVNVRLRRAVDTGAIAFSPFIGRRSEAKSRPQSPWENGGVPMTHFIPGGQKSKNAIAPCPVPLTFKASDAGWPVVVLSRAGRSVQSARHFTALRRADHTASVTERLSNR